MVWWRSSLLKAGKWGMPRERGLTRHMEMVGFFLTVVGILERFKLGIFTEIKS